MSILEINRLTTRFPLYRGFLLRRPSGEVRAVEDVSLQVHRGEILGLVGESGSVVLAGTDLSLLSAQGIRSHRADIQMIFQNPYASLNPRMTVYDTLSEAIGVRGRPADTTAAVSALMDRVGLPAQAMRKFPHEFSGGQRQRIAIARALAPRPKVLIADEPVSALDVSIAAQILNLLRRLCTDMELAMLFISHDLSVVGHIADRVAVMYLGRIVETGTANDVLGNPAHPYAQALLSAVPETGLDRDTLQKRIVLQGDPPSPITPPAGCAFHPRCRYAIPACSQAVPGLEPAPQGKEHFGACIRMREI